MHSDTTPEAALLRLQALREAGPARRLKQALDLSEIGASPGGGGTARPRGSRGAAGLGPEKRQRGGRGHREVRVGQVGESERHLRDVAEVVAVQGEALDAIRIDRWAEEVDVRREWQRARNLARENEGRG